MRGYFAKTKSSNSPISIGSARTRYHLVVVSEIRRVIIRDVLSVVSYI